MVHCMHPTRVSAIGRENPCVVFQKNRNLSRFVAVRVGWKGDQPTDREKKHQCHDNQRMAEVGLLRCSMRALWPVSVVLPAVAGSTPAIVLRRNAATGGKIGAHLTNRPLMADHDAGCEQT